MATANPIPDLTLASPPASTELLVVVSAMLPEHLGILLARVSAVFRPETLLVATETPPPANTNPALRILSTPLGSSGWSLNAPVYAQGWRLCEENRARAVLMLGPGAESLEPSALLQLGNAVLSGSIDLALPRYALPPHAGLINSAILYPLTRALFATRARFPLAIDMGLSARLAQRLAMLAHKTAPGDQSEVLLWPVNEAAAAGYALEEFDVGARALPQPADADINTLLARVTGSFFADIEAKAAYWQRARRIPPPRPIQPSPPLSDGASDVPRMVESFHFAYNNLLEIWSLVLPPHSLLGLKRLSSTSGPDFRMPDSLWVRIVYDFLVAYRQRTINRGHLLGAFIPLYLAWVASHINIAAAGTGSESHIEAVAAAFETDKPYLLSRWRWPDRFNA